MIFVPFLVLSVSFLNTSINFNQLPQVEAKSSTLYSQAASGDNYAFSTRYYSTNTLPAITAHREKIRVMEEVAKFEQAKSERDVIEREIQAKIRAEEESKAKRLQAQQALKNVPVSNSGRPSSSQNLDVEGLIRSNCELQGCNSEQLIRIMYCESGGRTNAYNPSGASGVFQFMPRTFAANAKRAGIENADIWNGEQQVRVAAYMFARNQAWQWVCK